MDTLIDREAIYTVTEESVERSIQRSILSSLSLYFSLQMVANSNNAPDRDEVKKDNSMTTLSQQQRQSSSRRDRQEEMILLNRFYRVASARLEQLVRQSEESGGMEELRMGEAERQIIRSMSSQGVVEGMVAGIVTFGILRKGPLYIARYVHNRNLKMITGSGSGVGGGVGPKPCGGSSPTQPFPPKTADGYQFSVPTIPGGGSTSSSSHQTNPFQAAPLRKDFPRSRNVIIRSVWFCIDTVLSVMMGASVCMAYTDLDAVKDQIVALPLVPGRSLSSEALCDVIVKELSVVRRERSPAYQRLVSKRGIPGPGVDEESEVAHTTSKAYLQAIEDFSANCQRRQYVERTIREEQGLPPSTPVEIRSPISPTAPRWREHTEDDEDDDDSGDFDVEGGGQ